MKTYELEMDSFHFPEEIARFLDEHGLKEGDTLRLMTDEEPNTVDVIAWVVIVVLAIVYFFRKTKDDRISDGERILDSVFKGKTVEEIEQIVQEEYGIKIEHQVRDKEDEDWHRLSAQGLNKAYAVDEQEYFEADIKEPNPEYKAWKGK